MRMDRLRHDRRRQAGRSLVEIMVALAIAAVILAAILITVSGTGLSGRRYDAQARLNDEGQVALSLMNRHLRMAGFWIPGSPVQSLDSEDMLRGCRNGFNNPTAANFANLSCASGAGNDAIAVRYDGRQPGITPTDCLGASAGIPADGWVDNRFYIAQSPSTGNPALYCRGNGGGGPEALVDNVEAMRIQYGIAAQGTLSDDPVVFDPPAYGGRTVRYLNADSIASCASGSTPANSWCAVTSIRVCLLMRTEDGAADEPNTPYIDCDGNTTSQADRRIRRAMVTTISLRNRTSVSAP
ncbi:type IV pilus assembly protein PilW [Caldimonas thermodepolymerans]|jgi:type IV pilus assembly protein PilW|nr:type IV pilus assembly protein PilW [Caldimonas thermodepolymerans]TCP08703.1 type IV pilus assembly protein PilW [Caldimonas thermodepolymerans]